MAWTSQKAHALDADAQASSGTSLKYDALRLFESAYRRVLNKRSRTNLCTDWGWGKQRSRGFYPSIQEAF